MEIGGLSAARSKFVLAWRIAEVVGEKRPHAKDADNRAGRTPEKARKRERERVSKGGMEGKGKFSMTFRPGHPGQKGRKKRLMRKSVNRRHGNTWCASAVNTTICQLTPREQMLCVRWWCHRDTICIRRSTDSKNAAGDMANERSFIEPLRSPAIVNEASRIYDTQSAISALHAISWRAYFNWLP